MQVSYIRYPADTLIRANASSFERVIGVLCNDNVIRTGIEAIQWVKINKDYKKLVTLAEAKFMTSLGLGERWNKLAECDPIFCLDSKNEEFFLTHDMLLEIKNI